MIFYHDLCQFSWRHNLEESVWKRKEVYVYVFVKILEIVHLIYFQQCSHNHCAFRQWTVSKWYRFMQV